MQQNLTQSELWAIDAAKWRMQEEGMKPLYDEIIRSIHLPPNSSVLDIGCGTGFFLSLISEKDYLLHGIDISSSQIEFAKKHLPQGNFQMAAMEQLPFPGDSMDCIVSNNSLQFSSNFEKAIEEVSRVLKPGKPWIISLWDEPSKSDAFCFFKVFYELTNQSKDHSIPFNLSMKNELENVLQNSGFTVSEVHSFIVPRVYKNLDNALEAILSSGPANHAIKLTSYELVRNKVSSAIQEFLQEDGRYQFNNSFVYRLVTK